MSQIENFNLDFENYDLVIAKGKFTPQLGWQCQRKEFPKLQNYSACISISSLTLSIIKLLDWVYILLHRLIPTRLYPIPKSPKASNPVRVTWLRFPKNAFIQSCWPAKLTGCCHNQLYGKLLWANFGWRAKWFWGFIHSFRLQKNHK